MCCLNESRNIYLYGSEIQESIEKLFILVRHEQDPYFQPLENEFSVGMDVFTAILYVAANVSSHTAIMLC
jgi:hypothetical protein